ncbi:hypothetical protein PCE1_003940 [Barthelona sp. PCE]
MPPRRRAKPSAETEAAPRVIKNYHLDRSFKRQSERLEMSAQKLTTVAPTPGMPGDRYKLPKSANLQAMKEFLKQNPESTTQRFPLPPNLYKSIECDRFYNSAVAASLRSVLRELDNKGGEKKALAAEVEKIHTWWQGVMESEIKDAESIPRYTLDGYTEQESRKNQLVNSISGNIEELETNIPNIPLLNELLVPKLPSKLEPKTNYSSNLNGYFKPNLFQKYKQRTENLVKDRRLNRLKSVGEDALKENLRTLYSARPDLLMINRIDQSINEVVQNDPEKEKEEKELQRIRDLEQSIESEIQRRKRDFEVRNAKKRTQLTRQRESVLWASRARDIYKFEEEQEESVELPPRPHIDAAARPSTAPAAISNLTGGFEEPVQNERLKKGVYGYKMEEPIELKKKIYNAEGDQWISTYIRKKPMFIQETNTEVYVGKRKVRLKGVTHQNPDNLERDRPERAPNRPSIDILSLVKDRRKEIIAELKGTSGKKKGKGKASKAPKKVPPKKSKKSKKSTTAPTAEVEEEEKIVIPNPNDVIPKYRKRAPTPPVSSIRNIRMERRIDDVFKTSKLKLSSRETVKKNLKRVMFVPEDQDYQTLIQNLPRPGSGLLRAPPAKKSKKKGKKGKKGKKKGKGKKRK